LVLSGIVCVALYMVVSPAPAVKRAEVEPASRTLAYQDKIARAAEEAKQAAAQEEAAASETSVPATATPAQATQAAPAPGAGASAPQPEQGTTEMAALPPG
jgi:predicted nucleic acid-binding Zn ribbon protein